MKCKKVVKECIKSSILMSSQKLHVGTAGSNE